MVGRRALVRWAAASVLVAAPALLALPALAVPAVPSAGAGSPAASVAAASVAWESAAVAVPAAGTVAARVPSACRQPGFTICVNKNTRLLYAFRSGRLVRTFAARFGSSSYPTRNGWFHVTWKSRWHYSSRYHSAMPFSLFFAGGQAIHYSSNFARVGYDGASHGCINLRSWSGAQWVFDNARVGTTVYVGRW